MDPEDVIVNDLDVLSDVAHFHDEPRKIGEYKPTNVPLSKFEIDRDEMKDTAHRGWAPRTTENIGDLTPLPEEPSQP